LALRDRAQEAESLLGHKIFAEAVAQVRSSILIRILASPINDPEILKLHAKAKALDELIGELKTMVTDLKMAKKPEE
jgi:hypothetical protein